ncbi:YdcF family protein [Weizmannia ginsengihumi]|nr:YdcF family protein [Heyndrickxia ginsengihumi]
MFKLFRFPILLVIGIGLFLWILTSRWMANGKRPLADGKYEYALVLGAKVNGKELSNALRYRLEAALEYANRYPAVKLILSGGQGPDEEVSEAEAMKTFLVERGISEDRLILESASTSTYENILFSKKLLPRAVKAVTLITNDYHLKRAKVIAKRLGLKTDVVLDHAPKSIKNKSQFRERAALLKTHMERR